MLQVFVTHNIRIRGASTPLRAAVTKALTFDNPAVVEKIKRRQPVYGLPRKLELYVLDRGDIVTPRGFLPELSGILRGLGIDPKKVTVTRQTEVAPVDFGPWNAKYQLKDDQLPAVAAAVEAGSGVLVAPAGSGKTVMGMRYIYEMKQPALWLTHTVDLLNQSVEKAYETLQGVGRVGILGDGKQEWGSGKLIVATVQTLQRNERLIETLNPLIGTVVIDEAHHFPAPALIDVAGRFAAVNMLGVTATPDRKDKMDMYLYKGVGAKVYEIKRDGLYETGRLVKPEVRFIYTDFSQDTASDRNENDNVDAGGEDMDYTGLIKDLIADEKRAKLVAESILDNAAGNHSIVITESVRYCYVLRDLVEKLAKERYGVVPRMAVVHGGISQYTWRAAGTESNAKHLVREALAEEYRYNNRLSRWEVRVAQYTDDEMAAWQVTSAQRAEIMAQAKAKQIDILFATQLAREGLDMPHLTVGHMAMPKRGDASDSKNGAAVEQEIGRIMRPDPSNPNKKAVWFDYVDYNVGVFQSQYQSRRSVYKRLGITLPRKPKTEKQMIEDFLGSMPW
ncbi:DNA/RNA helicase, superfamily II [Brevibacillus sp. CF112]|uniref:DEAD/DEAH box helicase n=1 Tax=Brevibacillus TaxID=55080 RepID=UPI000271D542|nr:DEAD/DEAH box helicase [Brevibacillus sp. CF112]EJL40766.1 DNA/RNA helicase, superfamily II [Brevibacillus sp. CF112]